MAAHLFVGKNIFYFEVILKAGCILLKGFLKESNCSKLVNNVIFETVDTCLFSACCNYCNSNF